MTPAWRRFPLTEIVFAQRKRLCDALDAECVVIADDENIDLALANGFHVLERPNYALGRKYNDGYEFAHQNGFTHVSPLGADSWALPSYFSYMPSDRVVASTWMCVLANGVLHRLHVENANNPYGCGPWIIPTQTMSLRPLEEQWMDGVDRGVVDDVKLDVLHRDGSPLQEVSFKDGLSATPYERLRDMVVSTYEDAWEALSCYPADLVERMRRLYGGHHRDNARHTEALETRVPASGDPVRP